MLAAATEPERFAEHVLKPCAAKSAALVAELVRTESPFVFVHDDLASATGPVFAPAWYDEFIFPLYPVILAPARAAGKKLILVADGNMTAFLPQIAALFDGFMCENPATPLESVIEHFGRPGKFIIGGIETVRLSTGAPWFGACMNRQHICPVSPWPPAAACTATSPCPTLKHISMHAPRSGSRQRIGGRGAGRKKDHDIP
jgi:hypothetical protein